MFRSPAFGVSATAGYNGLPQTVAENVMPIEKIKWSDAVVNKFQVLVIPLLSLIAGCTNMAGDVARTIHPAPSSALDENTLFSVASEFFIGKDYECDARHDLSTLRCAKELRDLYIHQTQAVVQIYPGDDVAYPHTLVTSRWDEGLIPGEFISSEFTNSDVTAFCEYLQAQAVGSCRLLTEHGSARSPE